jgi:hypothetical protein
VIHLNQSSISDSRSIERRKTTGDSFLKEQAWLWQRQVLPEALRPILKANGNAALLAD